MQSYPNTSNPVLFKALDQYQQSAEKDPKVNIIFTTSGSTTVVSFLYAEHSLLDSDAFSAFAAIDSMHALSPPTNGTIRELCFAIGGLDSPLSAR